MNLYAQFESILKNDNIEEFKKFFNKYSNNFDIEDYTLIIKYSSKNIYEYYFRERILKEYSEKYQYLFDIFSLSLFYKYLVLYSNDDFLKFMLDKIIENYTYYCESRYDVDYDFEFNSEHPFLSIAMYCSMYNTRIELFKATIHNRLHYFSEFNCLSNNSDEFFEVILNECHDALTLCSILQNCNETQLKKLMSCSNNKIKTILKNHSDMCLEAIYKNNALKDNSELSLKIL